MARLVKFPLAQTSLSTLSGDRLMDNWQYESDDPVGIPTGADNSPFDTGTPLSQQY